MSDLAVMIKRTIRAPVPVVFSAWTEPEQVQAWWGPVGMTCVGVELDLRIGGAYAIGNQAPDGQVVWIRGTFLDIEAPRRLVYSWGLGDGPDRERVTVRFAAVDAGTEVTVVHERIADEASRASHELGWNGCLDGLGRMFAG